MPHKPLQAGCGLVDRALETEFVGSNPRHGEMASHGKRAIEINLSLQEEISMKKS